MTQNSVLSSLIFSLFLIILCQALIYDTQFIMQFMTVLGDLKSTEQYICVLRINVVLQFKTSWIVARYVHSFRFTKKSFTKPAT